MEITAECLNSHFITPFLLTCICSGDWFFLFFSPPRLSLSFFFPGPPSSCLHLSGCLRRLSGQRGCFRLHRCSKCGVGLTEARGSVQPWTHLQEASERVKAPGWSCYIPPLNTIRLSVCKSDCLSTPRRSVLSHLWYLLSHTPCLPLPAFHCLSLPSSRIVSLYLALL